MEGEVAEDVFSGGRVALYGGLVGAAKVKVLQEDTGHRSKAKVVGVDEEEPLVPMGEGRGGGGGGAREGGKNSVTRGDKKKEGGGRGEGGRPGGKRDGRRVAGKNREGRREGKGWEGVKGGREERR